MEKASENAPLIPRFSVEYMDNSADPREDFYRFSVGAWLKANPVPPDKAIWTAFDELRERNLYLLKRILEDSADPANRSSASGNSELKRIVGDFYRSAMDTRRTDALGISPIADDLKLADWVETREDLVRSVAELKVAHIETFFSNYSVADKKNSAIYAYYIDQGGLSLPDREYYLADSFAELRELYRQHLARMFAFLGENADESKRLAGVVLEIETGLAKNSRTRTDLRDEEKNYNRMNISELEQRYPSIHVGMILRILKVSQVDYLVVGQPEFFEYLESVFSKSPIEDLKTYIRWRIFHSYAPFLNSAVEGEDFDFFKRKLLGQQEPEPRWKIAVGVIDELVGEALGKLYVDEHFPPEAKRRVATLIDDMRTVFSKRLENLQWMTEATKKRALAKFDRFTVKIGHPERFRDYGPLMIEHSDYVGNVRRSAIFEVRRQAARVGKNVDEDEWLMTPPTVNAYFAPMENQIVFPAGILQPPYFDFSLDDAVNYGGIGAVIGHEITHGYDDQGRKFDSEGNLRDWWTKEDEVEFQKRAKEVVNLYNEQEPLPGMHVNGELTLGENIADFGGVSIAFEALERRLEAEPSKRILIDGLTPEQRFFIAWAQAWRGNVREEEALRRLTIDPHSPVQYRAVLPSTNHSFFDRAFPPKKEGRARNESLVTIW